MDIAFALHRFLVENHEEISKELLGLQGTADGSSFQMLRDVLHKFRTQMTPSMLPTGERLPVSSQFKVFEVLGCLMGITEEFPADSSLSTMMSLPATIEKKDFQRFITHFVRSKAAYFFRAGGRTVDDLEVKVRDSGVLFQRTRWHDLLLADDVVAEMFVEMDCKGEGQTLGEIVSSMRLIRHTAVDAVAASLESGVAWSSVISEKGNEALKAYSLVEKWVESLTSEEQELLTKHPEMLKIYIDKDVAKQVG